MIILGIETSCDETAAAVISGQGNNVKVLSNVISSQIEIHRKYGGVVPEVAAREHVLNILPVVNEALKKAKIQPKTQIPITTFVREKKLIDAIAVTVGPGLITSLIVGVETAKTLAFGWQIPAIGINHIEGHIYGNFINRKQEITFPALILTVSGGHTMLVLMKAHGKLKVIGETLDDAAGEAFDKAATMIGIGYPGGPAIAAEAEKIKNKKLEVKSIKLPRPMISSNDFNFSFSGLKTALLYAIQRDPLRLRKGEASKKWKKKISEYCAEFQQAVVDVLVAKTIKAAKTLNCRTIMLSGGVASNKELRIQLNVAVKTKLTNVKLIIPEFKYCADNAAMIATAGYFKAIKKDRAPWQKLKVDANLEFGIFSY